MIYYSFNSRRYTINKVYDYIGVVFMAKKRYNKYREYDDRYDDIPNDSEGRMKYIMTGRGIENIVKEAARIQKRIKKIKFKKITFIWYTEPSPSKRPRVTTLGGFQRIYVPGAAINKNEFQKFFKDEFDKDFKMINTPMSMSMKVYFKTPASYNRLEKILAEAEILRPWNRANGDNDNNEKSYWDAMTDSVISDDCLVCDNDTHKYYSIKPRVEFEIKYMEKFPEMK